jgi:hypothetical protein
MSTLRILGPVSLMAATTAAGLTAGWFARSQTQSAPEAPPHGASAAEAPEPAEAFSERALKNMGVACAPVAKSDYTVCREVLAVVAELPTSLRTVSARWGGTVSVVLPNPGDDDPASLPAAVPGRLVKPGETLAEVIRAPLPKLARTLTGDVVQMVSETVHEAAVQLRSARRLTELAKTEYERVRDLNRSAPEGMPLIPRQTEINLQYDIVKAQTETERLEARLLLHGYSPEMLEGKAMGSSPVLTPETWRRALERNGLWSPQGERILAKLPENLRSHPWTFAALGELTALGKCDAALSTAIAAEPVLATRFHETAALLQDGYSIEDVLEMSRSGALDPVMRVRAPVGAPVWEVRDVRVKPGEKVEAGTALVSLVDNRRVALELEASVEHALKAGTLLEGRPLSAGAGPVLKAVRLTAYASADADPEHRAPRAYAMVENGLIRPPAVDGMPPTGTWQLRPGMRYRVLVPAQVHRNVFAVPRAALVTEGPEKVLLLRSGKGFRRQPVRLLHEDRETVVLEDDGAVFPGDPVVVSGAFALSLALRAEATGGAGASKASNGKHGPTCQH